MPPGSSTAPHGPEQIRTPRLVLRRPRASDAEAIFTRYASDPDVTRLVGWPRHTSVDDTRAFLQFDAGAWEQSPAASYLIEARDTGALLGSTGYLFEAPYRAMTGYVLAKDAWRFGYATEALQAVVVAAPALGVRRLFALCHHEHRASARVLEKCRFSLEGVLRRYAIFPNLDPNEPQDVLCYAILL
jgi:[ribosomal protein S5]-alanine N-acetyltransferase